MVGCHTPDLAPGFRVLQGDVDGSAPLSDAVTIVADNQQHYLYGEPVWVRTALVDEVVGTAIRAPQLDLFGPSVLDWVLKNHGEKRPVVHLGDGLDLSCAHEFDRFLTTMDGAKHGWFIAPGNHDGIYFGSSSDKADWARACSKGGGPISQARFLERYLSEGLAGRRESGPPAPKPTDAGVSQFADEFPAVPPGSWSGSWAYRGDKPAFLTRLAWRIDRAKPHHSYLLQELTATAAARRPQSRHGDPPRLDASAVKYVLLDTCNYEHEPTMVPVPPHVNPGATGDLRADQLEVLEGWLEEYRASSLPHTIVLMGHHRFGDLTQRAREKLDALRRKYGVLLYVSAHSHDGEYITHEGDESGWLELNVGSTVDYPLEFRTLRLLQTPGGVTYSNSELFRLGHDFSTHDAPLCAPGWQPQRGEPDYYIDYTKDWQNPMLTQGFIFNSLLASYRRMLKFIPTDPSQTATWPRGTTDDAGVAAAIDAAVALASDSPGLARKRELLLALERFDATRHVPAMLKPDPANAELNEQPGAIVHRDYRLCQAIWASQDDEKGARRARPEDWYIQFPPRKVD